MSSIVKRGGTWYACYYVDGKLIRKATGIKVAGEKNGMSAREKKKLAEMTAQAMESAARGASTVSAALDAVRVAAGKWAQNGMTWAQLAAEELEIARGKNTKTSLLNARLAIEGWQRLMPDLVDVPPDTITEAHVQKWVDLLRAEIAEATIKKYLAVVRRIFQRALKKKLITDNPADAIELHIAEKQSREPFSPDEVKKMIELFPGEWPDMVRVCLLLGGQRLGDIAQLRWDMIDRDRGYIAIRAEKTKRRMLKPLIAPLADIFDRREKEYAVFGSYVFPVAHLKLERAGMTNQLSREFILLLKRYGIVTDNEQREKRRGRRKILSKKSFHSLRATAVTWLLNNGVPAEMVRYIVGHSTTEIERAYYYKPMLADEAQHISKMADVMFSGDDGQS